MAAFSKTRSSYSVCELLNLKDDSQKDDENSNFSEVKGVHADQRQNGEKLGLGKGESEIGEVKMDDDKDSSTYQRYSVDCVSCVCIN